MAKKRKTTHRRRRKSHTPKVKHHRRAKVRIKKPKKPKKPKRSASLSAWENYDRRMSDWHARVRHLEASAHRKQSLMLKHRC